MLWKYDERVSGNSESGKSAVARLLTPKTRGLLIAFRISAVLSLWLSHTIVTIVWESQRVKILFRPSNGLPDTEKSS